MGSNFHMNQLIKLVKDAGLEEDVSWEDRYPRKMASPKEIYEARKHLDPEDIVGGAPYRKNTISLAERIDETNRRMDDLEQRIEVLEYDMEESRESDRGAVIEIAKMKLHTRKLRHAALAIACAFLVFAITQLVAINELHKTQKEIDSKVDSHIGCHEEVVHGKVP